MKRSFSRQPLLLLASLAALLPACAPAEADGPAAGDDGADSQTVTAVPAAVSDAFDPNAAPSDTFKVVGAIKPPSWSWGEIELLEGNQIFRTEGHNRRTQKLRSADTFQSSEYPLRTFFGALNQSIVDAFNLAYKSTCANGSTECATPGPTRPAARYVLLHKGPKTATLNCDRARPPVLLVHGALQDANVWLFPNGNDGQGRTFGDAPQSTGMAQALEADGRCVYAVTYGNFHGDNYNQAIQLSNALRRVRALHGGARADVIAWSKGVLSADAYLSNAATWGGFGTRYFDQVAAAQAANVPLYRDDIRGYVALSGPHGGLDLNFRHPIHTLTIASTSFNAPVGRGPMPWTFFSALQCVTWGPDSPFFENPYAASVCEGSGGTWTDYFRRIYISNLTGLDAAGRPVAPKSLRALNVEQGLASSAFSFDEYNLSLFGSVDEQGKFVSANLGQLQAARDLRATYPIPARTDSAWDSVDADEERWFPWMDTKLVFNPFNPFIAGGYLNDSTHKNCRTAAFEPRSGACSVNHAYNTNQNAEGFDSLGYARYRLFEGLGIAAAEEMGGFFIKRLSEHGLDPRLRGLFVLYGSAPGGEGAVFETDGRSCPTCDGHSDGVLFEKSVAAVTQLTQGWTSAQRTARAKQEAINLGHLEVGVTPSSFARIITYLKTLEGG
jgi:hypothetical protein